MITMNKIKIAIFTDDFMSISAHPGRACGLLVCEIQKDGSCNFSKIKIKDENDSGLKMNAKNARGQHRCSFGQSFIEAPASFFNCNYAINLRGCNVVIIRNAGSRFFEKMRNNGIKIIITETETIREALFEIFKINDY